MQLWLWIAFFVVANFLGVEVFKAAVDAAVGRGRCPRFYTVILVVLTTLSATRILAACQEPQGVTSTISRSVHRAAISIHPCGSTSLHVHP